MYRTQIIGHIGKDAETRNVGDNVAIGFNVAHTESYIGKDGAKQEKTTWIQCTLWRKPDKIGIVQYLKKGVKVLVEGKVEADAYLKDGNAVGSLKLTVQNIELLSSKSEAPATTTEDRPTYSSQELDEVVTAPAQKQEFDDLPF